MSRSRRFGFKNLLPVLIVAGMPIRGHAASTGAAAREVLVSAAASLKDVLGAITPAFEKANPGIKLTFNYGASGQLRMQIENGAPVDLFISAAMSDMDTLEQKALIVPGTRKVVAKNTLVLVRNRANHPEISKLEDLTKENITRIAMGNPATVPAGRYAKETLEKRGIHERLKDKLILAENVRQVLDYVARGEVDAGFVYKTDALIEPKSEVVETIPSDQHQPILYPAAILKTGKNVPDAKRFMKFLRSRAGSKTFQTYGFE